MRRQDVRPMSRRFTRAGPFIVTELLGNIGEHQIARIKAPMDRRDANYRGMMVSGAWRTVEVPPGATPMPDLAAPARTIDRPPFDVAGRYITECTQDGTLFICVTRLGGGSKFRCRYLVDYEGEVVMPFASCLAVGMGGLTASLGRTVEGPAVVYARSGQQVLQTTSPVRGILATPEQE